MLGSIAVSSAQTVGKAYTLSTKPIVETTAQIMQRERQFGPKLPIRKLKDTETEHEIDRDHLPQNPLSPASPMWPPVVNDVKILPPGDTTIGDGKTPPPPNFSVPVNFGGPTLGESGFVPPDSDGDVSYSSVIVAANGRIKGYDRLGNLSSLNATTDNFFASVRGSSTSDPRVVFDKITNRWFVEIIDVTSSNNRICIAYSNGEVINASTTWTFFQFAQNVGGGASGFADYGTLGVDANGVYVGTNRFTSSFQNCDVFAINKANLLSGTLTVTPFRNMISSSTGMFTPWPATNDDPTATVAFVVGVDAGVYGKLDYRRITYSSGTFSISGNSGLTVPTTYSPLAMPIPTSASTTGAIDSLDDRLFYARVCRNRLTGEVNVHTAHGIRMTSAGVGSSGGDRSGARWYNIGSVFSGTASLLNSGTVVDGASSGFKYLSIPSVGMNGQGHQYIGFTMGNATNSPGVGGSLRLTSDALVSSPTLINAGANYYAVQGTSGTQRWGDYSFTMVDPRDMMSFWTFQEYCNSNNSWQVRCMKILAPAPTVSGLSPSSVTQGDTTNIVVTGTGIFDPDSTYPDHLAFSFGANITVNSVTWNSATQATVNITVGGSAATGSRTVTLTNPDGQTATGSITVNTGLKTVSGTLALTSYTGSVSGLQFVYELRDASTNALIETHNITGLGSGNTFSFTTSQAAGNYK
ncbi:MAG: hypothetical protein GC165_03310, partial [Armatimonadetes bacterium]|nr:hypothetical protein [Armatimonadota bacterium]